MHAHELFESRIKEKTKETSMRSLIFWKTKWIALTKKDERSADLKDVREERDILSQTRMKRGNHETTKWCGYEALAPTKKMLPA